MAKQTEQKAPEPKQEQKPLEQKPRNGPVHEIRIGLIRGTVWANQGENGPWHTVTFSRSYKQGDEWKQASTSTRDDLLVVSKVADLAHTWVCEHQGQRQPE
jgi:hypothetical protein